MPFKSQAQRAYMYATHPRMAREWELDTTRRKKLPERAKKLRRKETK